MSEQTEQSDESDDRRIQGIKIKLPGGGEIQIRGLTTIMALLLVLTGVNTWIGWTLIEQLAKLADAVQAQTRAVHLSSCVIVELDPQKRKERYEECQKWFGR